MTLVAAVAAAAARAQSDGRPQFGERLGAERRQRRAEDKLAKRAPPSATAAVAGGDVAGVAEGASPAAGAPLGQPPRRKWCAACKEAVEPCTWADPMRPPPANQSCKLLFTYPHTAKREPPGEKPLQNSHMWCLICHVAIGVRHNTAISDWETHCGGATHKRREFQLRMERLKQQGPVAPAATASDVKKGGPAGIGGVPGGRTTRRPSLAVGK